MIGVDPGAPRPSSPLSEMGPASAQRSDPTRVKSPSYTSKRAGMRHVLEGRTSKAPWQYCHEPEPKKA
jgi:hypothetical protein